MGNSYAGRAKYITNDASCPPHNALTVTPIDDPTVGTIPTTRYLYIGVAGNVNVTMPDSYSQANPNGVPVLWQNLSVGLHAMHVCQVYNTGTTATGILACY